ncbi:cullin-associated and neddylation-dissociated 1, partial [Elysia marginata]
MDLTVGLNQLEHSQRRLSKKLKTSEKRGKRLRKSENGDDCNSKSSFDYKPYVKSLYSCTVKRLKAADIDQEVKERAIACMGQIIANLGDSLQAELKECLPIFLERLKNEITRLTTVKALTLIA